MIGRLALRAMALVGFLMRHVPRAKAAGGVSSEGHSNHLQTATVTMRSTGSLMSTTTPIRVNSVPWSLWLVPIVLLLVATERMPYAYYTLTKITVCGFALLLAFLGWENSLTSRIWSTVFVCVAILFNPIVPIYLSRGSWYDFDVGVAIIMAVHLAFIRLRLLRTKGS